jgi:hypothetical protein
MSRLYHRSQVHDKLNENGWLTTQSGANWSCALLDHGPARRHFIGSRFPSRPPTPVQACYIYLYPTLG